MTTVRITFHILSIDGDDHEQRMLTGIGEQTTPATYDVFCDLVIARGGLTALDVRKPGKRYFIPLHQIISIEEI